MDFFKSVEHEELKRQHEREFDAAFSHLSERELDPLTGVRSAYSWGSMSSMNSDIDYSKYKDTPNKRRAFEMGQRHDREMDDAISTFVRKRSRSSGGGSVKIGSGGLLAGLILGSWFFGD